MKDGLGFGLVCATSLQFFALVVKSRSKLGANRCFLGHSPRSCNYPEYSAESLFVGEKASFSK